MGQVSNEQPPPYSWKARIKDRLLYSEGKTPLREGGGGEREKKGVN